MSCADAQPEAAGAPQPAKPGMRLPVAVVKPKRKAEPPGAIGAALGQPAKRQEVQNGSTAAQKATAPASTLAGKEDSGGSGTGLGGLAAYGSESD
jgi:hypothetical protein